MLKEDGGIKALLGMAKSGSSEVIAQVARGLANFAKCESRGTIQGWSKQSFLWLCTCIMLRCIQYQALHLQDIEKAVHF